MENESDPKWNGKSFNIAIDKKGLDSECDTYRAICSSLVVFKIYTKMIEWRIREIVESKLEDEQSAFRQKRGTTHDVFIVKNIIDK